MSDAPQAPIDRDEPADPGGGKPPGRRRTLSAFGPGGWARRFAKLWGFLLFCLFVLFVFRHVVLPFVFAILLAYVLSPVVRRMSQRSDGTRRMPRGLAIIICYLTLLAVVGAFLMLLLPRLSDDLARIGREAPRVYERLNEDWAPRVGRWLEQQFPSMQPQVAMEDEQPLVADVPLPPGTTMVVTPLPDGRFAVALEPSGVRVQPQPNGSFVLVPNAEPPEPQRVEDRIRALAGRALRSVQSELVDAFRFGRTLIAGAIAAVIEFFLVLMVAAFILIDLEKIHAFARSLVPMRNRDDYDVVVAGMDRGLSGVIRGQLMICLVNGVLTYIGLLIFSVKYSLVLAFVAGVLSFIPIFGSILSTIPIVLVALVSSDTGVDVARGVFMLLWVLGIHFLEGNFLNPKILGETAKIHPVLIIFALLAGEHTYGLVGALLAVPVASMIQVLFQFFRNKAWKSDTSGIDTA